ncbi:hypothetical protein [Bordetella avium]|uniref:hypothetical protein n=1 Tax=Bordetella avium TaxID=521 RepID=UPI0011C3C2EC|nr:hypothetical protein [Bordetella avium]
MSKAIDRRIRALETARPQEAEAVDLPQWLVEWERDSSVFRLMNTVVTFDNREQYGHLCTVPTSDQADAAKSELHARFGDVAAQWLSECGAIWRELQDKY